MNRSLCRRSPAGFVLAELLMVLTIILLLMALLLPALAGAQDRARTAVCMNNVRQSALFTLGEVQRNRGVFPPFYDAYALVSDPKVLICPNDVSPGWVPNMVDYYGGNKPKGKDKGEALYFDTSKALRTSYGFNPEYSLYRVSYDAVPVPSSKMIAYDGFASASGSESGSELGQFGSFGGEVWFHGNKVTLTHLPPGNKNNGQLITIGQPALHAHIGHEGTDHQDLFGNWLHQGKFDALYTMQRDFVRRHALGLRHGNIVFLDGHAEERKEISPDMVLFPAGVAGK